MDYKKLVLLLVIIGLGLYLKGEYDQRKVGATKKEAPVVKGVTKFVGDKVNEGEGTLQEALGNSTQFLADQASKSANIVTSFILEKSSQQVVEQINKLPEETKKEVKESICR